MTITKIDANSVEETTEWKRTWTKEMIQAEIANKQAELKEFQDMIGLLK